MKTTISLTTTLAALLPLTAAFAQAPAPTASTQPASSPATNVAPAPPVPPAPPGRHFHERDNRPQEPVTFLGVETSQVPRVLSEQMNLPRGFGVVVDSIVPKSPAAEAGLQRSDIIRMLNDQIIVSPDQLGTLVRSFAEGTSVTLTILRKGQEMKLPVKLAKHQTSSRSLLGSGEDWDWNFDWDDGDKMKFDFQMPDMTSVRESVKAAVETARDQAERARDEAQRAGDEARRAVSRLRIVTKDNGTTKSTKVDLGNATITFSDDKGELKLESRNGNKVLSAKDAQGKVLFEGPVNTDEERAKIPSEVRQRFEKLQQQELPEVPPAPEPPAPPDSAESVRLELPPANQAVLCATRRTGWTRSTLLL